MADNIEVITNSNQVLRARGKNWEIITQNYVLREFLEPGGDYQFWIADPTAHLSSSGGNIINWRLLDNDIVELTHQLIDSHTHHCQIDLSSLMVVINRLANSRHVREKYAKAQAEWDAHHAAWLVDPATCTSDKRKNCGDETHQWFENNKKRSQHCQNT